MTDWTYDDLKKLFAAFSPAEELDNRREKKRRRILRAATELFIRHGYRKASMDEVAIHAGVAKGTVYLYFPSKADLLIAALTKEKQVLLNRSRAVFENNLQGAERLRFWLLTVIESQSESPLHRKLLQGDHEILAVLDDLDHDLVEQSVALKVSFLAPLIASARGRDTPLDEDRTAAKVLMGTFMSSGFFQEERMHLGIDSKTFHQQLVDLLVRGLVADTGSIQPDLQTLAPAPGGSQ